MAKGKLPPWLVKGKKAAAKPGGKMPMEEADMMMPMKGKKMPTKKGK